MLGALNEAGVRMPVVVDLTSKRIPLSGAQTEETAR